MMIMCKELDKIKWEFELENKSVEYAQEFLVDTLTAIKGEGHIEVKTETPQKETEMDD